MMGAEQLRLLADILLGMFAIVAVLFAVSLTYHVVSTKLWLDRREDHLPNKDLDKLN